MPERYLELICLIACLNGRLQQAAKQELDDLGLEEISGLQGTMLLNIDQAEVPLKIFTKNENYLDNHGAYNIKKMTNNGYLELFSFRGDRRRKYVRISQKGLALQARLIRLYLAYFHMTEHLASDQDMRHVAVFLRELERATSATSRRRSVCRRQNMR